MRRYPHTIYEIFRETISTIPEKTDKEIYFPQEEPLEEDGIYLLSGQWMNLEDPNINIGPLGKYSLMKYTNPDTLKFSLSYQEKDNYIQGLFSENKSLLKIDSLPITPGIDSLDYIFFECENLETLDLHGLDLSGIHRYEVSFQGCTSLKNIIGPFTGITRNISFGDSPLTLESVMTVFEALVVDHESPRSITISEETYNLLSQEQFSIPESKGWAVITL